jgi:uncharacterized protein (DUF1810 family)
MPQSFGLDRFVQAQDRLIEQARQELRDGRKRSHWMWFVFPQLSGLGHSSMSRHYAIASLEEAAAYLKHPILGPRLVECSDLVNRVKDRSVSQIFGNPDDLKFHSCMTLFSFVEGSDPVFRNALAQHFDGSPDLATTERLTGGAKP